MSAAHPLARDRAEPTRKDSAVPEALAELSAEISARLAELEQVVRSAAPGEAERVGRSVAALRELVDRQVALQSTLAQRLESQIAERTRELGSLSEFLQTHSEREKASLARELHDSLGGILTPAKMDLAWLEARLGKDPQYNDRVRRLSALIDQGIDLKRRIIETLRPSLLDHLGLASALQWYVDEACRDLSIDCRLHISENLERMPPDIEIALYRVVQEGIGNVLKHASANVLDLVVERTPEGLRLTIADDGVGISDLARAKRLSHGMAGMMHRVRTLGGSFEVRSEPGRGTRLEVFVPLK